MFLASASADGTIRLWPIPDLERPMSGSSGAADGPAIGSQDLADLLSQRASATPP